MKNVKYVRILNRVARYLEDEARDERDDGCYDMEDMYNSDAKDYRDIAKMVGCDKIKEAEEKYDGLDTAARDCLYETPNVSEDDENLIGILFGYIDDDDLDDDDSDVGGGKAKVSFHGGKPNIDHWVRTRQELKDLAKEWELRSDWHEADTYGIETILRNGVLDNAHCDEDEAHIILIADVESNPDDTEPQTYAINLAVLLAWATTEGEL